MTNVSSIPSVTTVLSTRLALHYVDGRLKMQEKKLTTLVDRIEINSKDFFFSLSWLLLSRLVFMSATDCVWSWMGFFLANIQRFWSLVAQTSSAY